MSQPLVYYFLEQEIKLKVCQDETNELLEFSVSKLKNKKHYFGRLNEQDVSKQTTKLTTSEIYEQLEELIKNEEIKNKIKFSKIKQHYQVEIEVEQLVNQKSKHIQIIVNLEQNKQLLNEGEILEWKEIIKEKKKNDVLSLVEDGIKQKNIQREQQQSINDQQISQINQTFSELIQKQKNEFKIQLDHLGQDITSKQQDITSKLKQEIIEVKKELEKLKQEKQEQQQKPSNFQNQFKQQSNEKQQSFVVPLSQTQPKQPPLQVPLTSPSQQSLQVPAPLAVPPKLNTNHQFSNNILQKQNEQEAKNQLIIDRKVEESKKELQQKFQNDIIELENKINASLEAKIKICQESIEKETQRIQSIFEDTNVKLNQQNQELKIQIQQIKTKNKEDSEQITKLNENRESQIGELTKNIQKLENQQQQQNKEQKEFEGEFKKVMDKLNEKKNELENQYSQINENNKQENAEQIQKPIQEENDLTSKLNEQINIEESRIPQPILKPFPQNAPIRPENNIQDIHSQILNLKKEDEYFHLHLSKLQSANNTTEMALQDHEEKVKLIQQFNEDQTQVQKEQNLEIENIKSQNKNIEQLIKNIQLEVQQLQQLKTFTEHIKQQLDQTKRQSEEQLSKQKFVIDKASFLEQEVHQLKDYSKKIEQNLLNQTLYMSDTSVLRQIINNMPTEQFQISAFQQAKESIQLTNISEKKFSVFCFIVEEDEKQFSIGIVQKGDLTNQEQKTKFLQIQFPLGQLIRGTEQPINFLPRQILRNDRVQMLVFKDLFLVTLNGIAIPPIKIKEDLCDSHAFVIKSEQPLEEIISQDAEL